MTLDLVIEILRCAQSEIWLVSTELAGWPSVAGWKP